MARPAFPLLLFCAACSAECGAPPDDAPAPAAPPAAAPAPAPPPAAAASPLILYDAPLGRPYMQALTRGVLTREGACTYLAAGPHRTLLILPSPTARWDAEAQAIRFGRRTYRFGDQAVFGGGETAIGTGPQAAEAARRGCDTTSVWWASPEDADPAVFHRPVPIAPPPPPAPPPMSPR